MRVIAGKCRRTNLRTPEGLDTRPTTDRIKETLFNMISSRLYGCRFLDLFSGSGGIGIEAASRGAAYCVLVDHNKKACQCIQMNLEATRMTSICHLMEMDIDEAVNQLDKTEIEPFEIIFMDPPYGKEFEKSVLTHLNKTHLISEDTLLIVEASLITEFDYLPQIGLHIEREKIYKTNKHVFIKKDCLEDNR